jgi:hypothetical protein
MILDIEKQHIYEKVLLVVFSIFLVFILLISMVSVGIVASINIFW